MTSIKGAKKGKIISASNERHSSRDSPLLQEYTEGIVYTLIQQKHYYNKLQATKKVH